MLRLGGMFIDACIRDDMNIDDFHLESEST